MTPRQQRERELVEMYTKEFAKHELAHVEWGGPISTFVISRTGSNHFYTEVYVGRRHVTVQGDVELISFAGGYQQHPQRLTWAAQSNLDYLWEKARIGSGHDHTEWSGDLAVWDILMNRRCGGLSRAEARAAWNVLDQTGDPHEAMRAAYAEDGDFEISLGKQVSSGVILAWVAIRTLVRLLDEKKKWPPSFADLNALTFAP